MAGQNMERREVLRALSIAAVAAGFPGFERWAFAFPQTHDHRRQPVKPSAAYRPRFFTPAEYELLSTLAEIIIPSDETPGAREAGVNEFVDFIVFSDPALQYPFRSGLRWMNAHARYLSGRTFRELGAAERVEVLEHLAYRDRHRTGEEDGRAFFQLLREYVTIGFYTSRVGMEEIGFPGLQQYWPELPGCPHTDDPEHRELPPSSV